MQLLRLGEAGSESPYVRGDDGAVYDLTPLTTDIDGAFLARGGIAAARDALAAGTLTRVDDPGDGSGLRVGAPVARPQAVICIGMNYAEHAAETGAEPPERPIVFFKHPNTVVGPYDDVQIPRASEKTDWEVELAVVIGTESTYLDSDDAARAAIAGYAIANDVSERAFQLEVSGGQWSKGKCCPTFSPLGPVLVPADEVGDPQQLSLGSEVNGEERQDSTTKDMVFGVLELVRTLSQYMTLSPGDVICTGTPQGVALSGRFPYLKAGDVYTARIEGLGEQRQEFVAG